MPFIKPFRILDQDEIINGIYAYQGTVPATAGTFVKISSGWLADQFSSTISASAGQAFGNTLSPRWGVPATVVPVTASGDAALGILRFDVRETDENGEKLIYHPRKASENNWIISGEGAQVATRGIFIYSGVVGTPTAGSDAFLDSTGAGISTSGTRTNGNVTRVGKFLGPLDRNGWVLFKLEL